MTQELDTEVRTVEVRNDDVRGGPAALHAELAEFYARQMHLIDAGQAQAWAATFTEDGVFAANAFPEPTVGRAAIEEAVRRTAAQLAADRVVHRHWLGMLAVYPRSDGTVRTRYYALVIATPRGGMPAIHRSTVAEDELVRHDGGWLVRSRSVTRDDL